MFYSLKRLKLILFGLCWAFFCLSYNSANEHLINLYRTQVPFTFGLLVDLHTRIFTMQHSTDFCKTRFYVGESGNLQLHLNFIRDKLPGNKKQAETTIEDSAMKIKKEADNLARSLWAMFPDEIPVEAVNDNRDLVSTLIFLDGINVGFSDGERFLWKTQLRDNRVITNEWQ
jgi:hypothetical protein